MFDQHLCLGSITLLFGLEWVLELKIKLYICSWGSLNLLVKFTEKWLWWWWGVKINLKPRYC